MKPGVLFVLALALAAYVASFALWTRAFPAPRSRPHTYGFVVGDPDWETALRAFYYPLIRVDEAAGGPVHTFDLRYL